MVDAVVRERSPQRLGVCVDDVTEQDFGTDGDDFS
jgi:hypothetical protein